MAASKPDSQLLGKNALEIGEIAQFISMTECYIVPSATAWLGPINGYIPFNAENTVKAKQDIKKIFAALNEMIATRTFLVGQRVTLADIIAFCSVFNLYKTVLEPAFREPFGNVNRWFNTILNQPEVKSVVGDFTFCTHMAVYVAKPAAVPAKPVVAAAAAKKLEDDEEMEDEYAEKPKPKNALDFLPPSKFNLDEWKRFYSNNETRPVALNFLWEKFDKEGFSWWRVEYKFNEQLTKLFMTANLLSGFFNRLEEARKYAFGSMCILGKDNDSRICGYFIFRGLDLPEMVRECPDFDSYSFTKVNHENLDTRKDIDHYLAWDIPEFAEGKIFK